MAATIRCWACASAYTLSLTGTRNDALAGGPLGEVSRRVLSHEADKTALSSVDHSTHLTGSS